MDRTCTMRQCHGYEGRKMQPANSRLYTRSCIIDWSVERVSGRAAFSNQQSKSEVGRRHVRINHPWKCGYQLMSARRRLRLRPPLAAQSTRLWTGPPLGETSAAQPGDAGTSRRPLCVIGVDVWDGMMCRLWRFQGALENNK